MASLSSAAINILSKSGLYEAVVAVVNERFNIIDADYLSPLSRQAYNDVVMDLYEMARSDAAGLEGVLNEWIAEADEGNEAPEVVAEAQPKADIEEDMQHYRVEYTAHSKHGSKKSQLKLKAKTPEHAKEKASTMLKTSGMGNHDIHVVRKLNMLNEIEEPDTTPEELEEISNKTMKSYVGKAASDLKNSSREAGKHDALGMDQAYGYGARRKFDQKSGEMDKRSDKRVKGIAMAAMKLARHSKPGSKKK